MPSGADHSLALRPDSTHTLSHTPHSPALPTGWTGWSLVGHSGDTEAWSHSLFDLLDHPGRITILEIGHPGRLVSYFVILVIDFVTALFNLGV